MKKRVQQEFLENYQVAALGNRALPPEPASVLKRELPLKIALQNDALGALTGTNRNYLQRGDKLDPVLAHHLRRSHL